MCIFLSILWFLICFYVLCIICSKIESGGLTFLCSYVIILVFLFGVYWLDGVLETPQYDRCNYIKTPQGIKYEFCYTGRYCPDFKGVYTIIKKDSIYVPNRRDLCEKCGHPWLKHEYYKSAEEREIDGMAYEGLIIPVD